MNDHDPTRAARFRARCSCGQLTATAVGRPSRISVCHCVECQRRTGSAFGTQMRFNEAEVTVAGASTCFSRTADSGSTLSFHFCPQCGSTVYYRNSALPGFIGVTAGCVENDAGWAPVHSVYEHSRKPWVALAPGMERSEE